MITITNKLKQNEAGEILYLIKVNDIIITEFWHNRKRGLAECLAKASEAVLSSPKKADWLKDIDPEEYMKMVRGYDD